MKTKKQITDKITELSKDLKMFEKEFDDAIIYKASDFIQGQKRERVAVLEAKLAVLRWTMRED